MKQNQIVQETIYKHQPNELIFANKVYSQQLDGKVSEAAYYKTLERMCKAGTLAKAAKGTYYIPKQSSFGVVPPSEREIVSSFTKNHSGTVIGYTLYNQLGLTTQIAKTVEVLSSAMETQVKTIRNVVVHSSSLSFSKKNAEMIHALEVMKNISEIQDINYSALVSFFQKVAAQFDQAVFDEVISIQHYSKRTIAFFQEILNYYQKPNSLQKYLSSLSTYHFPKMEELYEAAQLPQ